MVNNNNLIVKEAKRYKDYIFNFGGGHKVSKDLILNKYYLEILNFLKGAEKLITKNDEESAYIILEIWNLIAYERAISKKSIMKTINRITKK